MSVTDLITLSDLLNFTNNATPSSQVTEAAQQIIDGWTDAVYWITGRTAPMLSAPTNFTETYNGSGSDVLYLINAPILSVSSLTVNGTAFPQSTVYGGAGWFIQQDGKSIALRSGALNNFPFPLSSGFDAPYLFARGRGNVVVSYQAGYNGTPADLYLLSLKQCAMLLAKRLREDALSQMIPDAGTNSYRQLAMSKEVREMLIPYTRTALSNIFGSA